MGFLTGDRGQGMEWSAPSSTNIYFKFTPKVLVLPPKIYPPEREEERGGPLLFCFLDNSSAARQHITRHSSPLLHSTGTGKKTH